MFFNIFKDGQQEKGNFLSELESKTEIQSFAPVQPQQKYL